MTRGRKRAISETDNNNDASAGSSGPARKTARPEAPAAAATAAAATSSSGEVSVVEKVSLHFNSTPGQVLTLGEGDTGQLGLGEDALSRKRPAKVDGMSSVVQAVAGGMHTACLTADGRVLTFGCNDEQALGRPTTEDGSEYRPCPVAEGLPDQAEDPVVHLSAGDSHTAATTRSGLLYLWGTFRDSNGIIGLTRAKEVSTRPVPVEFPEPGIRVAKTASGACHVVCLSRDGRVFTLGCGEQGQLGRVSERVAAAHGGRAGMQLFLAPREVRVRGSPHFTDVWAGAYVSFARSAAKNSPVYAWGLNNYYQLGTGDLENKYFPSLASVLSGKQWRELSSGQHHTLALEVSGQVYAIGRGEYGRLGRGADRQESSGSLEPVGGPVAGARCVQVSCATACSYCVTEEGLAYSWGMGSNKQLGHGEEDEDACEPGRVEGKQLDGARVISVSGGGQHAVLLVAAAAAAAATTAADVATPEPVVAAPAEAPGAAEDATLSSAAGDATAANGTVAETAAEPAAGSADSTELAASG